ncbi:MAG: hypothetical protein C0404_03780 [Verrucomicrobia bacterium]|nr:hypothetical protein [Verrucomicrobiota bacterium]
MDILVWLYMTSAVLLILHEMDSAYWKEWNLFKRSNDPSTDTRDLGGFLIFHIPLLFLALWGLLKLHEGTKAGLIVSLVFAATGLFAFVFHMVFLKKGRPEFRAPVSICILCATLLVSIAQLCLTIARLMG